MSAKQAIPQFIHPDAPLPKNTYTIVVQGPYDGAVCFKLYNQFLLLFKQIKKKQIKKYRRPNLLLKIKLNLKVSIKLSAREQVIN